MSEPRWVRIGTLAEPPAERDAGGEPLEPAEALPTGPREDGGAPGGAASMAVDPACPDGDGKAESPGGDTAVSPAFWAGALLAAPDADLEHQLLARWRDERRRVMVVLSGGSPFAAQIVGAGQHVLYVADASGQGRLIYRWAIRELIPLDE